MWNRFRNIFRAHPTNLNLDLDTPFALYFAPSGKVSPITLRSMKSFGWGGYDALQNSMARPNSNGNAPASELGYAYISEINVWVRRCIEIRAQNLARLDWYVEDKRTGKRVDNHPMMVAINRSRHFFVRYARSMDIWGEVYLKPVANRFNYYSDVWWLNNLSINFAIVNGQIDQFNFVPLHGGKPYAWRPDEVAYIYNENAFDDLHGSSRILSVLAEANVHEEIARSAQAHFANDARPGIMFIPENDLGVPQSQEFIDYWKANFQGSLNTNKPVMLPMRIKNVQTLERAALKDDVELRGSVRREICAAFGVPLSIAGAWDDANYQSAPEQRKSLYEDTLIPEAEQMCKDIDRILLPFYGDPTRERMCFDAKKLLALAEDKQAKATALNSQLVSGGITLNQYREALDLEAIPQGNVFYIPSGVVVTPIDKIGTMPPPAPPGGFGFQSAPALPAPVAAETPNTSEPPIEEPAKSGQKVSVTLSLANNPDCMALQQRLKELYAAVPMQWTSPDAFHITLITIPAADDQQIHQLVSSLDTLDTTPLSLPIGSLASFDNVGEHALHFRIRRNQALLDLQEDVYVAARNAGCALSSYSDPRVYIPHVTMGYAPQHIRAIAFNSKLSVQPSCLAASCEKDGQWRELKRLTFAAPIASEPEPEPVVEDIATEPVRSDTDVILKEFNAFRAFHLSRWDKPARDFKFEHITDPLRERLITARAQSLSKDAFRQALYPIQADWSESDHPREPNGQFGNGGGGSSGGGDNESEDPKPSEDKPKPKPKKPKPDKKPTTTPDSNGVSEGKPSWAGDKRMISRDADGYMDYGHIDNNPVNTMGDMRSEAMSKAQTQKLDSQQTFATKTYTGEAYTDINGGLRAGKIPPNHKQTVTHLDSAIGQSELPENTVLYRGMTMNDTLRDKIKPGSTFTDKAYTSTSLDQGNPDRFAGGENGAVMRIKAPKGQKGLALQTISDYPEEKEVLLPRNTQYKITSVTRDPSTGRTYIDAEIVGEAV